MCVLIILTHPVCQMSEDVFSLEHTVTVPTATLYYELLVAAGCGSRHLRAESVGQANAHTDRCFSPKSLTPSDSLCCTWFNHKIKIKQQLQMSNLELQQQLGAFREEPQFSVFRKTSTAAQRGQPRIHITPNIFFML